MSFTTNGNMHRHLRIHEKELEASGTPLSKELHQSYGSKSKGRRKLTDSEGYEKMEEYSSGAKRKLDIKEESGSHSKWSRLSRPNPQLDTSFENGSEVCFLLKSKC